VVLASPESDLSIPSGLDSPAAIQTFLDGIPYSTDPFYRSPKRVVRDRKAHCFDGAVFAAAALRRLGIPPRIVDMLPEEGRDDDHLLAVFLVERRWGAIAKSNFVGLRFREPVYASLRELVMSYFEAYYNTAREKTLRGYTVPLRLEPLDPVGWESRDETMELIAERLEKIRRFDLLTPRMIARLSPVDPRSYEAGLVGVEREGLYKV
jgi:transglutaminase superfamily protein